MACVQVIFSRALGQVAAAWRVCYAATVIQEITENGAALAALCRRFRVSRLELFGSAAGARFNAGRSDLDFLVDFLPLPPWEHSEAYFGLLEALQDLFQRSIDLVEVGAIRNPYFRESVDRTRVLLYAA
jgi:hypothetical protein